MREVITICRTDDCKGLDERGKQEAQEDCPAEEDGPDLHREARLINSPIRRDDVRGA